MKIRLRPYHPEHVIIYSGCLDLKAEDLREIFWGSSQLETFTEKAYNEDGFIEVVSRIKSTPKDIEIEIVEEYDDICLKCYKRVADGKGSVWGEKHSCTSSRNPAIVKEVKKQNEKFLRKFGLQFGSTITLKKLVYLFLEKGPINCNDPKKQKMYEKGLKTLCLLTGVKDGANKEDSMW